MFVYLGNGDVSIRNVGKAIRKYNLKWVESSMCSIETLNGTRH